MNVSESGWRRWPRAFGLIEKETFKMTIDE
jgi:hypothetical protein